MSEVTINCPDGSVSDAAIAAFEHECRVVHTAYTLLTGDERMPLRAELLITANLEATVRERMRKTAEDEDGSRFEAARFGLGRVAAKNLAQDERYDHVVIVFDGAMWSSPTRTSFDQAQSILLIAHELAHPVFARTRMASRVAADVIYPSYTPGEIARSLGRILMDEYRADWLADLTLGAAASNDRGEPVREWELDGHHQFDEFKKVMTAAHVELADAVRKYRLLQIDLMTMWSTVTRWTEFALTSYVHVRAAADGATARVAILDEPTFAALPFARAYLSDTITPLINALRDGPVLPTPAEWVPLETAVTAAAETAIREIWRRLGLTFVEAPGRGQYRIEVKDAPA